MTGKPSLLFIKTVIFTGLALIAFAANSVLCRLALGEKTIDATSFTVIRLLSGAVVLWAILKMGRSKHSPPAKGSWGAGFMLFVYAVTFSFAYITLDTGTGALILFASVQITMISMYVMSGNRLDAFEQIGVAVAFIGFVYLILPGVRTPSVAGLFLMTAAGAAWGVYTLKGRNSSNPLVDTGYNFLRTVPMVLILVVPAVGGGQCSTRGIVLAVLSGGIASGIGYTLWYAALKGLSGIQAAVVQLLVPAIAALGGVIFVSETATLRLVLSGIMILGGILMAVRGGGYLTRRK